MKYTCRSVGACREVSPTTKVSVEVQTKSSHLPCAKTEQSTQKLDLENLFNMYWTSKAYDLTVSGQSWPPTSTPLIPDGEAQRLLSLGTVLAL